jgi:hypothetical protein
MSITQQKLGYKDKMYRYYIRITFSTKCTDLIQDLQVSFKKYRYNTRIYRYYTRYYGTGYKVRAIIQYVQIQDKM